MLNLLINLSPKSSVDHPMRKFQLGPGGMPVTTDTVVVPAETNQVANIKSVPLGSFRVFSG